MQRILLAVCTCLAALGAALAQAPETKVSLAAAQSAVKPGSSTVVGIHFQLPAGWHMYWINPGDAGEPPKVQWSLPPNWTAGELQWPAPARLVNAAGVDYGYEGDVTLLSPIKAGPSGGDIMANLRWLVCKDICVPQKGTAKLSVEVATNPIADTAGTQVIDSAKAKLPKAMPAQWKANGFQNPGQVILNFRPGIKVQQATFFPEQPEVIENSAPQKLSSTSYAAQLTMKKAGTGERISRLKGVLLIDGASAYAVDVPVK